jgi:hypothetical protein
LGLIWWNLALLAIVSKKCSKEFHKEFRDNNITYREIYKEHKETKIIKIG